MSDLFTIVNLWGASRRPTNLETENSTPSNIDKGVREIAKRPHIRSCSIYPSIEREKAPSWIKKLISQRASIAGAVPRLISLAEKPATVTYTSDIRWAFYCGLLKKVGILRCPSITYWAGFDVDFNNLKTNYWKRLYYSIALNGSDICRVISARELELWKAAFPQHAERMRFHPTSVDFGFYEKYRRPWSSQGPVVVIGDDRMRDWSLPLRLAEMGRDLIILSSNKTLRHHIDSLAPAVASKITLLQGAGFVRSAEVAARASCLLLSTLPNDRFSGATTVGVAVALGIPLILDEPYDLAAYGLQPGVNCETYQRGDPADADRAIDRITSDVGHGAAISESSRKLRGHLDIRGWADVLDGYVQDLLRRKEQRI